MGWLLIALLTAIPAHASFPWSGHKATSCSTGAQQPVFVPGPAVQFEGDITCNSSAAEIHLLVQGWRDHDDPNIAHVIYDSGLNTCYSQVSCTNVGTAEKSWGGHWYQTETQGYWVSLNGTIHTLPAAWSAPKWGNR